MMSLALLVTMLVFGILQIYLGLVGLYYIGGGWLTWGSIAFSLFFRIMLPFTIGTYFGVVEVYDYEWWLGVLVAAPGILFMVPAFVTALIETIKEQLRGLGR